MYYTVAYRLIMRPALSSVDHCTASLSQLARQNQF